MAEFSDLLGKVLTEISVSDNEEEITFYTDSGEVYLMYHEQDCCESVYVEDVIGDLSCLIGSPILQAEESSSYNETPDGIEERLRYGDDSFTWTFYKLATIQGYVTIRWLGESNGYYSESVDFKRLT